MDVKENLKKATAYKKAGDLNSAIDLLMLTVDFMKSHGGFGHKPYTKIIPYFQKANRYDEGVRYALNELIPAVTEDTKRTFRHKEPEIGEALCAHSIGSIYQALSLAAKREKRTDDQQRFFDLSEAMIARHKRLLDVGSKKQLEAEYIEYKAIFGLPTSEWSETAQMKFAPLIERDKETEQHKSLKGRLMRFLK